MPQPIYTLNASGITPKTSYAHVNLAGCHITLNTAGTEYLFTEPDINKVLAHVGPPLPSVPFSFELIDWQGVDWTITVNSVGTGTVSGTWSTPGTPAPEPGNSVNPQNGDYTAQTGGTITPEEAAHAAGYGKK